MIGHCELNQHSPKNVDFLIINVMIKILKYHYLHFLFLLVIMYILLKKKNMLRVN